MLMLLLTLGASIESATTIPFANGREYTVSVCLDSLDWGMAYLTGHGMQKPIADVMATSELQWFRRRDGSAVLLIESYRVVLAFTITRTGKVYPHERMWDRDADVTRCGTTSATVMDCQYHYSPAPGARDLTEDETCIETAYEWSRSRMKWKPRIVGYH